MRLQHVGTWAVEQSRQHPSPIGDLILHDLKKVYVTGELGLLDREAVVRQIAMDGLRVRRLIAH